MFSFDYKNVAKCIMCSFLENEFKFMLVFYINLHIPSTFVEINQNCANVLKSLKVMRMNNIVIKSSFWAILRNMLIVGM